MAHSITTNSPKRSFASRSDSGDNFGPTVKKSKRAKGVSPEQLGSVSLDVLRSNPFKHGLDSISEPEDELVPGEALQEQHNNEKGNSAELVSQEGPPLKKLKTSSNAGESNNKGEYIRAITKANLKLGLLPKKLITDLKKYHFGLVIPAARTGLKSGDLSMNYSRDVQTAAQDITLQDIAAAQSVAARGVSTHDVGANDIVSSASAFQEVKSTFLAEEHSCDEEFEYNHELDNSDEDNDEDTSSEEDIEPPKKQKGSHAGRAPARGYPQKNSQPKRPKKSVVIDTDDEEESEVDINPKDIPQRIVNGIADHLPPLSDVPSIFEAFAEILKKSGDDKVYLEHMNGRPLRVATVCSGTESPLMAIQYVAENLKRDGRVLELEHIFSGEIVPWKQRYIESNFRPPILFRDITEFSKPRESEFGPRTATTAYGARVEVPGDVDLLVAGTCCVDFSTLNRKRQALEANGESGLTFFATLKYMVEFKPKMVIFENVKGAPWHGKMKDGKWQNGIDHHIRNAGYASRCIILDTKDFFIPHTRQRGYMLCLHMREAYLAFCDAQRPTEDQLAAFCDPENRDFSRIFDEWERKVRSLGQPASASADAFLLDANDARVTEVREDEQEESARKSVSWEKCKDGHFDYRSKLGLGNKHQLTNWSDNSFKLPDYVNSDHMRWSSRMLDMMDIYHAQNLLRGIDDRFFARHEDYSQNCYRAMDKLKHGITGCQTPKGISWSTLRARRIFGPEVMTLQGIDTSSIYMTNLSHKDMQDLAGNAMTSTVVGATIFACLAVCHKMLERGTGLVAAVPAPETVLDGKASLVEFQYSPTSYKLMSVQAAQSMAAMSAMLCNCEHGNTKPDKVYQQCRNCRLTTCTTCGGNPEHDYVKVPLSVINARIKPITFETLIEEAIPRYFSLAKNKSEADAALKSLFDEYREQIDADTWTKTRHMISTALCSELCLRDIKRKKYWEITYDSPAAVAVLRISRESIEWLFCVNASKLPLADALGIQFRKFPFLRMKPDETGLDITKGRWQFWLPKELAVDATITSHGRTVSSRLRDVGLTAHANDFVATEVEVTLDTESKLYIEHELSGSYRLYHHCGQAFNSLHIKVGSEGTKQPQYLFFHHELAIGDPMKHSFIFSQDCSRIGVVGKYRDYSAAVSPLWRQPFFDSANKKVNNKDETKIHVHGSWKDVEWFSLHAATQSTLSFNHISSHVANLQNSCDRQYAVVLFEGNFGEKIVPRWARNEWIAINKANEAMFVRNFGWAINAGSTIPAYTNEAPNWQMIDHDLIHECPTCVPVLPSRLWELNRKGTMVPYERPDEAGEYEHCLRNLPAALSAQFFISTEGVMKLKVSMNPTTLVHRAVASLQSSGDAKLKASWLLVTNDDTTKAVLSPLKIQSNRDAPEAQQPSGFRLTLRPEQLRALQFALQQENNSKPFMEERLAEEQFSATGMRLWGMAQREKYVKGGLLAFEVGFGKTAVALALIDHQREQDCQRATQQMSMTIPIKATFIIVPDQLPYQWKDEVAKFYRQKQTIQVIKNTSDLDKLTIADFKKFDIIIITFGLFASVAYRRRLANFAALVGHHDKATNRAKHEWYKIALPHIYNSAGKLQNDPNNLQSYLVTTFHQNLESAARGKAPTKSKRVIGAALQKKNSEGNEEKQNGPLVEAAALKAAFEKDLKRLFTTPKFKKLLVLEAFIPSRIIVDEPTYVSRYSNAYDFIKSAITESKFLMSGTFDISGFNEVNDMANLIGINLGEDDIVGNLRDLELTSTEEFIALSQKFSPALKLRRNGHTQNFLDQFARSDIADIDAIELSDHMVVVHADPTEHAIYLEFSQKMVGVNFDRNDAKEFQSMEVESTKKTAKKNIFDKYQDGRDLMVVRASSFKMNKSLFDPKEDLSSVTPRDSAAYIIQYRKNQLDTLKQDLAMELDRAIWLEKNKVGECRTFEDWQKRVRNNEQIEDSDASTMVQQYIEVARASYQKKGWRKLFEVKPLGACKSAVYSHIDESVRQLRITTTKLNKFGSDMVSQTRSLRFFEAIQSIQACSFHDGLGCSSCTIQGLRPCDITVLFRCGHIACNTCLGQVRQNLGNCRVVGCGAWSGTRQMIPGTNLIAFTDSKSTQMHGKKLDEMLATIKSLPISERVLIFAQHPDLIARIKIALSSVNISFVSLEEKSSQKLLDFQRPECTIKVLILNIGDASAAGSNLTVANHVIFVAPLLTRGTHVQQKWDAAMAQAIGRARRFGQTRRVHIYQYLTSMTIDVDIIEKRTGKILKRLEGFVQNCPPYADFHDSRVGLVEVIDDDASDFASTAAQEIFAPGSDYA